MHKILINELKFLRKGSGLTSRKLQQTPELRRAITEKYGFGADTLAINHVHNYLLQELNSLGESIEARAVRNAFGLGWENNPYNLLKRRADFSMQLRRHSDTVEAYENQCMEELAIRLVSALPQASYPEIRSVNVSAASQGAQPEPSLNIARKMIVQGLSELYGLGPHASEIFRCFGNNKSAYLDANVELQLLPSRRGPDFFNYKLRYTFRGQRKGYKLGIVTNSQDGELLANGRLVDDVYVFLNMERDLEGEISYFLSQSHFMFHDQETGTQRVLQFAKMDESSRQELLSLIWRLDNADITIIEVAIPEEGQKPGTLYEHRFSFDMPIDIHCVFWKSPAFMYLNNMTVDVSKFPDRDSWQFNMQPFMGHALRGINRPDDNRYFLAANCWLMEGNGMVLVWSKPIKG